MKGEALRMRRSVRRSRVLGVLPFVLAWLAGLCFAANGPAYTFGPNVKTLRSPQMVFDWTTDRCTDDDIPDMAARAFRDYTGRTQLIATHYVNHRYRWYDLNGMNGATHSCTTLIASYHNPDPSAYNDLQWLGSPYTIDGRNVFNLMQSEWRGWAYPGQCDPSLQGSARNACMYSAIVESKSTDGGDGYTRGAAPQDLVAPSQYRYAPTTGHAGFFHPSNIIYRPDGYYYMLIGAAGYQAQPSGVCLLRTRTLWDASSWRAWDGNGFNVRFIDPYVETSEPPQNHVCASVQYLNEQMSTSVTYNTYFGRYIATGAGSHVDPTTGATVNGFWYQLSSDLIHWGPMNLLMQGPTDLNHQCSDGDSISYPSLLDPTSPSRNYDTTGREPYLYYTVMHYAPNGSGGCILTLDRDLLRVWLRFTSGGATPNPPNCLAVTAQPSVIRRVDNHWVLATLREPSHSMKIEIYGVNQDEPTNGIPGARYADRPDQIRVRAAMRPDGDGRVYRINFIGTRGTGTCWGTAEVGVDGSGTAKDTANQSYNSLLPFG
jgi:hypothetical protein